MVWRLPHLGQRIGWEYTVARHSMSKASKVWPQSSHLNDIFPRNIVWRVFRIDRLWIKKRRDTILLHAFPKGYRQVTIRPTSIEQPTPYWREPPVCLFSVVENLAIFLGTRTRAKSSILLICYNSVFLERKRNDGFVSHSAADSVCFCFLSYVLVQPCILSVSRCRDAGVNTCSCLLCVSDIGMLGYTALR